MSLKNKLISAVLCAATLFGLAGCTFGKDFGTVVTVSGTDDKLEYGAGYYLYYQYSAFTGAAGASAFLTSAAVTIFSGFLPFTAFISLPLIFLSIAFFNRF